MPAADIKPGYTRRLYSQVEAAEVLHLSRNHVRRMRAQELFAAPDAMIGTTYSGWELDRLTDFGRAAGMIDKSGGKLANPSDGSKKKIETLRALVATRYSGPPTVYLGSSLIAALRGHHSTSVFISRDRGSFLPADIVISTRFGWNEQRVIEYDLQYGRIDDARIDAWAVERTAAHHLPVAPWVTERAAARPDLTRALADAGIAPAETGQ